MARRKRFLLKRQPLHVIQRGNNRQAIFYARFLAMVLLGATPGQASLLISREETKNVSCSAGACTSTARDAVLNVGELTALLEAGDLTVTTGGGAVDLIMEAPFNWSSSNELSLDAIRSVIIEAPIDITGVGKLTIRTRDGGAEGKLSFAVKGHVSFHNLKSRLTINGTRYRLVSTIRTLATDIAKSSSGNFALARSYDAKRDGTYSTSPIATTFYGALEGLGNRISNLTITDSAENANIGFIVELGEQGKISNLGLENINITGGDRALAGGLVVESFGSLIGDYVTGTLSIGDDGQLGGMVWTSGAVEGAKSTALIADSHVSVTESVGSESYLGGLATQNSGTIENSYASGTLSAGGGLVDINTYGHIKNSYSTVSITIGGGDLVGENSTNGIIYNSYATGNVGCGGGGLVGDNAGGRIVDSYATGDVACGGGLAGANESIIINCHASGNVTGSGIYENGGLVGSDYYGAIYDSYSTGNVVGGAGSYNGGLVGEMDSGHIYNSRASGTVAGGSGAYNGGLVGFTGAGRISNSFATGAVSSTGTALTWAGGLVGENGASILHSFATGTVTGAGEGNSIGGLAGSNNGAIGESYSSGAVSNGRYVGGMIGLNYGTVDDSYSTGAPTDGTDVGGLIGADFSPTGSLSNTYWDTTTSGISNMSQGAGYPAYDPGIVGLTTAQFQSELPKGFKKNVWAENANLNGGLPYLLKNLPPPGSSGQ